MEMAGSSLSSAVEVTVPSNSLWYTVVGAAYLAIGEPGGVAVVIERRQRFV